MATHKALGRGLEALFTAHQGAVRDFYLPTEGKTAVEIHNEVKELALESIKPNRHQPRAQFDPTALEELAESIKIHGLAQPLVVTELAAAGEYELIVGERRLRAAKMAGLTHVPCIIKKVTNRERLELALVENIQRQDLNAMEEAMAIDNLMKEYSLTQEEVSIALGQSRSSVANLLRYLRLHEKVQEAIRGGQISEGHAKVLAGVPEHTEQLRLLERIISDNLSVRDLEALVTIAKPQKKAGLPSPAERSVSPEIRRYEEDFQRVLGRRVEIQSTGKKGWLRFAFYSPWDLDILCKRLGLIKE